MMLTLEALYTLQLMNDRSDDIPYLPLPEREEGQTRKSQLQVVLKKGYQDLTDLGWVDSESEPSEKFLFYGAFIDEYATSYYHVQVDQDFFIALNVDEQKEKAILIYRKDDGTYDLLRLDKVIVLAMLIERHPVLQNLEDQPIDYLQREWTAYPLDRFFLYHSQEEAIYIAYSQVGKVTSSCIFVSTPSGLMQYDFLNEEIRSISPEEMKAFLIKKLKVEVPA